MRKADAFCFRLPNGIPDDIVKKLIFGINDLLVQRVIPGQFAQVLAGLSQISLIQKIPESPEMMMDVVI